MYKVVYRRNPNANVKQSIRDNGHAIARHFNIHEPENTLTEIIQNCEKLGLNAQLYDNEGKAAGYVQADGTREVRKK